MLIQYPVSCLDAVSVQYAYCVMMWYQCLHKSIVQIHFSVQVQLARTHLAVIRIYLNSLAGGPEDGYCSPGPQLPVVGPCLSLERYGAGGPKPSTR